MEIAEATTQPKRQRHEFQSHQNSSSSNPFLDDSVKRHKPYNTILNLLDDDDDQEQEQHEKDQSDHQDLSAIFTTLERELASPSSPNSHDHQRPLNSTAASADISDLSQFEFYQDIATANDGSFATSADEGEENAKSVMRHLLEASDDELGIPSNEININNENNNINNQIRENMGPFGFNDDNGFWEIEDDAANYYTELHSELFM